MGKAAKVRGKRIRRRENARLKYGYAAGPRHTRKGGGTGKSMHSRKPR